ncbi:Hypothetical predicted protein [Lecanosticta acicola]|uniref:Uncharacterized protein n=1 Tax=Lecanosticta acicola TaxID=111012 RepID=A0AAI8YZF2_9PEZI|nr:Hypothetical predicted protein [Lecanosticta acicola]
MHPKCIAAIAAVLLGSALAQSYDCRVCAHEAKLGAKELEFCQTQCDRSLIKRQVTYPVSTPTYSYPHFEPVTVTVTTTPEYCIPPPPKTYPVSTPESKTYPVTPTYPVSSSESKTYPMPTTEQKTYPLSAPESKTYPMPTTEQKTYPVSTSESKTYAMSTTEQKTYPVSTPESKTYPMPTTDHKTYPVSTPESKMYPTPTTEHKTYPVSTPESKTYPMPTTEHKTYPVSTMAIYPHSYAHETMSTFMHFNSTSGIPSMSTASQSYFHSTSALKYPSPPIPTESMPVSSGAKAGIGALLGLTAAVMLFM